MTRAALTVALVLFAGPAFAQEKGRKVAFLVGVGTFKHDLTDLGTSPQKDATELGKVLKDGGFEAIVLTDKEATKAGIDERFKKLVDGKGSVAKGDLLLVAMCTHGFSLPPVAGQPDQPFLAAHDSKLNKPDTMVSLNGLIADGKSSGATVLYLIDACRELPKEANRSGFEPNQVTLPKGTAVLFSCGRGQVSHQHEKADGHGLFTFAVLKTLKGERGLKDKVSWNGLVSEVEKAFESAEFQAMIPPGKPQTPSSSGAELTATELLRMNSLEADLRAYLASTDQDDVKKKEYMKVVAPGRLTVWREQAQKGNPRGQILYGLCLDFGTGVMKDKKEAVAWYKKAAEVGNTLGMMMLAEAYAYGQGGLPVNHEQAITWYKKAAEAGDSLAMVTLGVIYDRGLGGDIGPRFNGDPREAVTWFRRAAEAGNPDGMNGLGTMYEEGRGGLTKDKGVAIAWYKKAAAGGCAAGTENLKRLTKE